MKCLHPDHTDSSTCKDRAISCNERCPCCNPDWEQLLFNKERIELLEFTKRVANIFNREPDDAADFKDASSKIYKVWIEARKILGVNNVEEGSEDS